MLYFWVYSMGWLTKVPLLINTEICAAFLIGPFFYLYFSALIGDKPIQTKSIICHVIPFLISLVIIIGINLTGETTTHYENQLSHMPDYAHNKLIYVINSICDLFIAGYFLLTGFKTFFILKGQKVTRETKIIIIFFISFSFSAALLLTASFIGDPLLLQISIIFLSILPMGFIFFSFRYPDYAIKVIKEARKLRSSKYKELPYNIQRIRSDLDRLMNDKKLYRVSDISLNFLSEQLSVTSHELSYILNNDLQKNFNSYINSFRIEEAKLLILNSRDKSITDIAYDVGFNSTSSFYKYFLKETGISPKKFKKIGNQK